MMRLTRERVLEDIGALPVGYKTADVDHLIKMYVKEQADVSALREHILTNQKLHRIYYFVALKQMKNVDERMSFIHANLLFSDWWHTDQLINFVSDLDFAAALRYAKEYVLDEDAFVRRWGYVLFISKLGRYKAREILELAHNDEHYYVQMAEAWLIAEMAVFEPEYVYAWMQDCELTYDITGKAVQKVMDSFRISAEWKEKFKGLRSMLKEK